MKSHWKLLVNLLQKKPCSVGAELGVFEGTLSAFLLKKLPIQTLYCVDCWEHYPDFTAILNPKGKTYNSDMDELFNTYRQNVSRFEKRIQTLRMFTTEAVKHIEDESLDFIFIDANHAYEYVKKDIEDWLPKVKKGGLISGHDYGKARFGVTEAVKESFGNKFKHHKPSSVWWTFK